jgi:hypothetical protein
MSLFPYVQLHNTILERFRGRSFVGGDALELRRYHDYSILEGEIGCLGEIIIGVSKVLKYVGNTTTVEAVRRSYNVSLRGHANIFRYDDAPHHPHPDKFHRHEFNWRTGDQIAGSPFWVGSLAWPQFTDVLERAHDWYWDNMLELPNPEFYPENLRSELTPWSLQDVLVE